MPVTTIDKKPDGTVIETNPANNSSLEQRPDGTVIITAGESVLVLSRNPIATFSELTGSTKNEAKNISKPSTNESPEQHSLNKKPSIIPNSFFKYIGTPSNHVSQIAEHYETAVITNTTKMSPKSVQAESLAAIDKFTQLVKASQGR